MRWLTSIHGSSVVTTAASSAMTTVTTIHIAITWGSPFTSYESLYERFEQEWQEIAIKFVNGELI